ncbi:MAG: AMP-binding protein [Rhodospirillaceae bacterium]
MSQVLSAIAFYAQAKPEAHAVSGASATLAYGDLETAIDDTARALHRCLPASGPVAVLMDNGVQWVVIDLALVKLGRVSLPLPSFFTAAQCRQAMADCGAASLLTDRPSPLAVPLEAPSLAGVHLERVAAAHVTLHSRTAKITYTSGSTGAPKGLCLAQRDIENVALSLVSVLGESYAESHVPLLPLGVLLENVAGLYATLCAGGHYRVLGAARTGLQNLFAPDWTKLALCLAQTKAASTILVPELLRGLVAAMEHSGLRLPDLKLMAVGGARVSDDVLERAAQLGLPVVQGYGLSEAASVVSLNTPGDNRLGTVGRVLPHVNMTIAADGEIVIENIAGLGYVGRPPFANRYATGDIGALGPDGRLVIEGRKDNLIVTAYGRNISPEWIESELTSTAAIAQAFIFGHGNSDLGALLVPASAKVTEADLGQAVAAVNARLPAYARVGHWARVMPFSIRSGMLTANGRLRRAEIHAGYADLMARTLQTPGAAVRLFDRVAAETTAERQKLHGVRQIKDGLAGRISRDTYIAYLTQAYHHVRHTVPLFEAARARLSERQAWLRAAFDDYIADERGHDDWILNDIRNAGGDPDAVAASAPHPATRRMVEEAYRFIEQVNPVGLLGMVFVLEGTSTQMATQGATAVATSLGLPPACFSYLMSHGALDLDHIAGLQSLMDRIDDPRDQADIVTLAKRMFVLFADMFAAIPHRPEEVHAA